MYVDPNFKTKKALKEAIANGDYVSVYTVSPFEIVPANGTVYLRGPHYPETHKWYAQGTMKDGKLVKVT